MSGYQKWDGMDTVHLLVNHKLETLSLLVPPKKIKIPLPPCAAQAVTTSIQHTTSLQVVCHRRTAYIGLVVGGSGSDGPQFLGIALVLDRSFRAFIDKRP